MAIANLFVFLIVFGFCTLIGLDLKKWFNWLFVLYGFLSGFWIGFLGGGVSTGFQGGTIFGLMIISSSVMRRHYRQRYSKEAAED